jgi:hypothetical protein
MYSQISSGQENLKVEPEWTKIMSYSDSVLAVDAMFAHQNE